MSYTVNVSGHTDSAEEETAALAGMAAALRDLPGVVSAAFSATFDSTGAATGTQGDLTDPPPHIADAAPPTPATGPVPPSDPAAGQTATPPAASDPSGFNPPPEATADPVPVSEPASGTAETTDGGPTGAQPSASA